MPDRIPHPRTGPPTRIDHILAHAGTFAAATWWTVFGALLITPVIVGGTWHASPTLAQLPWWASLSTGAPMLTGGLLTMWGIQTTTDTLDHVWLAQKIGLILAAGGWGGYALALILTNLAAIISIGSGVTQVAVAGLSAYAVTRAERQLREEIRTNGMDA